MLKNAGKYKMWTDILEKQAQAYWYKTMAEVSGVRMEFSDLRHDSTTASFTVPKYNVWSEGADSEDLSNYAKINRNTYYSVRGGLKRLTEINRLRQGVNARLMQLRMFVRTKYYRNVDIVCTDLDAEIKRIERLYRDDNWHEEIYGKENRV